MTRPPIIDKEEASAGMMALFVIGLMMMLFIWIMMGGVFDEITAIHTSTSDLGTDFPVSDERVSTLNFLITGMSVIPFLGIFIPLVLYSVVTSMRKGSGGF